MTVGGRNGSCRRIALLYEYRGEEVSARSVRYACRTEGTFRRNSSGDGSNLPAGERNAVQPAFERMYSSLLFFAAGLTRTKAPPALRAPKIPTIVSGALPQQIPKRSPFPNPFSSKDPARASLARSSWP